MSELDQLLEQNRKWATSKEEADSEYFDRLAAGQSPDIFWLGCSDSRVPPAEILGLEAGDIFVHRNIANLVLGSDVNFLSTLQYAVQGLEVRHIIVCGHQGCGGVKGALESSRMDYVDNWIQEIKQIKDSHQEELSKLSPVEQANRLSELNVQNQVQKLADTNIVQEAWNNG
ncbi:MAG: carbonic anhydrase [bacterium]